MEDSSLTSGVKLPVWARAEAFPEAGSGWGWVDKKGVRHACGSAEELEKIIREDQRGVVGMVWTPEHRNCVVPEEVEAFEETIVAVRKKWAREYLADDFHRLKVLGFGLMVILGYMIYGAWKALEGLEKSSGVDSEFWFRVKWIVSGLAGSTSVGIAILVFLVFGFIPWYGAWKRCRNLKANGVDARGMVPALRFEMWLEMQRAPLTRVIFVLLLAVFAMQVVVDADLLVVGKSLERAGMVKPLYWGEREYWRILTAPMMHGGAVHFVMNALALLYLGKRVEVFAGWPHVAAVFLFSAMVGGETTARLLASPSVGASGGLMGLLGFLLVFETLHSKLVPMSCRRRLLGGVMLTALIGLVGYRFIDNAAHAGGLVAGMVYAGIVFPKSASVERPKMNVADRMLGVFAMMMLALGAGLAAWMIVGWG